MDSNPIVRSSTRLTRAIASSSVTIERSSSGSPDDSKRSLYLTLKMPSNKLREATSGSTRSGRRTVNVFTENPIVTGPRTSRPRKRLVEVNTSDEEDLEDQEEDEVDEEDAPGEDDEEVDADGDLDMDDAPPQPPPKRAAKAAAANAKSVKSVEAKEMELEEDEDEDDEELSEPDSDAEGEPDEESGIVTVNAGEEELDEEDEEEELDSDDETPALDSSRMTKRQRGSLGNDFLQLPMEPQVKKHLTAEERAMRRAEMARRRKNLSEKRNEEEKMDTINRLLRKQAPKRRGRIPAAEAAENASADQEMQEVERPDPIMVRWVTGREGSKVGVPEEWFGTPAGRVFGEAPLRNGGSTKLVEEV
jgi:Ino eighty subunit 2